MNLDTNTKPVKTRKLYIKNGGRVDKYFHPQYMTPELQSLVGGSPIARLVQTIIDKTAAPTPESAVRVAYCRPIPEHRSTDSLQVILTTMQGMPTVSVECDSISDPSKYSLVTLSCGLGKTQKTANYVSGASVVSLMRYASRLSDAGKFVNQRRFRDLADLRNKVDSMCGGRTVNTVDVPVEIIDYVSKVLSGDAERDPTRDDEFMKSVLESRGIIAKHVARQSTLAEFDRDVWVVMYHDGYGYTVTKGIVDNLRSDKVFRATLPPVYAPTLDDLPEAYRVPVMVKLKMLKAHREAVPDYPRAYDSAGLIPKGDKFYNAMGAFTYCFSSVSAKYPHYVVLA